MDKTISDVLIKVLAEGRNISPLNTREIISNGEQEINSIIRDKLEKILKETLVLPILELRKTHPDIFITEKGYETLINNAKQEILTLITNKK